MTYTATKQTGTIGNCMLAQVFGPDGQSVLEVEPTADPDVASAIAEKCAAALNAEKEPFGLQFISDPVLREVFEAYDSEQTGHYLRMRNVANMIRTKYVPTKEAA